VFADVLTSYSFAQENLIVDFFLYYFIGLVISRIGSLFVEPVLKKWSFLGFAEYSKFVAASKKDPKIDVLSETNNMYRTLCSMFVLLILVKLYEQTELSYPALQAWTIYIVAALLLVLFLYSYRKQTSYIKKRVELNT